MIDSYEPLEYPIFRRMDENVILGMSLKTILMVVFALLVGGLVFVASGMITHDVEVKASGSELSQMRLEYELYYDAICYEDLVENQDKYEGTGIDIEIATYQNHTFAAYSEEEIHEFAEKGKELGITKDMKRTDATALCPTYITEAQPVISDFHRAIICFMPAVLIGCLRFEREGRSLLKEIIQFRTFATSQKIYEYRRS